MKNRILTVVLTAALIITGISGCSKQQETPAKEAAAKEGQETLQFAAEDLEGNEITDEIFNDKKVTMINFWATFCGPCIEEMPDLGKLAAEMPEGSQLIGVVLDVTGSVKEENLKTAKSIVSEADAQYPQIIADDQLQDYAQQLIGVPTTIFVDENGTIIGEPIVGMRDAETYRKAVEEHLK